MTAGTVNFSWFWKVDSDLADETQSGSMFHRWAAATEKARPLMVAPEDDLIQQNVVPIDQVDQWRGRASSGNQVAVTILELKRYISTQTIRLQGNNYLEINIPNRLTGWRLVSSYCISDWPTPVLSRPTVVEWYKSQDRHLFFLYFLTKLYIQKCSVLQVLLVVHTTDSECNSTTTRAVINWTELYDIRRTTDYRDLTTTCHKQSCCTHYSLY